MGRKCLLEPQSKLRESPFHIYFALAKAQTAALHCLKEHSRTSLHGYCMTVHKKRWTSLSHMTVQKQPPHITFLTATKNAPNLGCCKANYLRSILFIVNSTE